MTNIEAVIDEYSRIQREYNEKLMVLQTEIQSKFKMHEYLKPFFDLMPNIYGVVWTQYTPYFNDGSPCVFSVNDVNLLINKNDDPFENYIEILKWETLKDYAGYDKNKGNIYTNERPNPLYNHKAFKCFNILWSKLDTNFFKALYGDHAMITVTKNETITEDYEHD